MGDRKLMSTMAVVGLTAVGSLFYEYRQGLTQLAPSPEGIRMPIGHPVNPGAVHLASQPEPEVKTTRSPAIFDYAPQIVLTLLTLGTLGSVLLWVLHLREQQQQQQRVNQYRLQMLYVLEQAKRTSNLEGLETLRQQLFDLAQGVIADWQQEQLSTHAVSALNFIWQVTLQALQHQQQSIPRISKQWGIAEPELMNERSRLAMPIHG